MSTPGDELHEHDEHDEHDEQAHDHGHTHTHHHHGHAHPPDHDPPHDHGEYLAREPLERGAGEGEVLFFDAFSGVAGDMTLAALIDLGVPIQVIHDVVAALPLEGYELSIAHATKSSIVGTKLDVRVTAPQPERTYGAIDAMLAGASLPESVRTLARAIFRRLGEAESEMHRMPLEKVHFHEVGAVDAIIDVVGAAAGLDHLGAEVVVSPLPMGRGFVRARHGVLPLPAPATVRCLVGVPTYGVDLDAELVTPTGAAIVATAAQRFSRWPAIVPRRVGFGAGTQSFADRPNLLRLVLGSASAPDRDETTHVLVEANLDDMTGELAAHAISVLLEAGAVDAWITPATGKKGRPCLLLAALVAHVHRDAVAEAMLRETTTIGVRFRPLSRIERTRQLVEVSTRFGAVPLKVSGGPHGPEQAKPEFDRCAKLAREHGVPVRVVLQEALNAYAAR